MEPKHQLSECFRDLVGDWLETLLHVVRLDWQELRGWEQPAHLRAVLDRDDESPNPNAPSSLPESAQSELTQAHVSQQREGLGGLLEAGAAGVEKLLRQEQHNLSKEEAAGLECLLVLYVRPAVLVSHNHIAGISPLWGLLEDQRQDIVISQSGVGRIEMLGHPELDWAGTGFLVSENCLLTTRRIAELFAEGQGNHLCFRPGITTWMDYRSGSQRVASAGYRVRAIRGLHDRYDLAVMEVEPPENQKESPTPLAIGGQAPADLDRRPVYLVGFPFRDERRQESQLLEELFRHGASGKRIHPGMIRGVLDFGDAKLLQHDCLVLGRLAGGCLIDLETHHVLGLNLAGRYLERSTAIPLWLLCDDPLLRDAGATFVEAAPADLELTKAQLDRLARSRYWLEAKTRVAQLYERAFTDSSSLQG
jgi:hypothetical protein